jgi:thiamine-monophosphate kinase
VRLREEIAENRLLARWGALLGRAPGQLGRFNEADAELVPLGDGRLLALTVDTVDEEVRAGLYRDPRTVGRIAAVAALSDLAAVGADPLGLLLSVGLPCEDRERVQEGVARGVREVCDATGTFVLGGDTNESEALTVAGFAAGLVPSGSALTRVGTRPGDVVAVSGPVGAGSALAATRLLGGASTLAGFGEGDFHPLPRLREGRLLRGVASACMDTSDGLVATLDQLARLNGVAIRVTRAEEELLEPGATSVRAHLGLPAFAFPRRPPWRVRARVHRPRGPLGRPRARGGASRLDAARHRPRRGGGGALPRVPGDRRRARAQPPVRGRG